MGLSPSGDRWRVWASGRKPSAGSEDRGAGIGRESRRLSDKAKREDDPGPGRQRVTSGAGQPTPALGGFRPFGDRDAMARMRKKRPSADDLVMVPIDPKPANDLRSSTR